jgi:diaminopimelate decarboxylase
MHPTWQTLDLLSRTHGDSFYLLNVDAFRRNYSEFLAAFRRIYPEANIAYSYKTNYLPRLGRIVSEFGGYAEVVSQMEYDLALRLGVPPARIIFNGPYKEAAHLAAALLAGSIVNLDAACEVDVVEALSRDQPGRKFTVGVRCNFDSGSGSISRFGFDIESDEFAAIFARLRALPNCEVGGLHCHFSTRERSAASYALRVRTLLALCSRFFAEMPPRFLNVGGGFFSRMSAELQAQFEVSAPTFEEYAAAIATPLAEAYPHSPRPELILEPGAALTADVMQFAARIVALKTVRAHHFALASGSVHNIKPTLHNKNLPLRVLRNGDGGQRTDDPVDIVGYTCMEHDCLHRGYSGGVGVGDYALFGNVGAYTIVMKPPFIRPCPAVVGCDDGWQDFELLKRPEEMEDVFRAYVL